MWICILCLLGKNDCELRDVFCASFLSFVFFESILRTKTSFGIPLFQSRNSLSFLLSGEKIRMKKQLPSTYNFSVLPVAILFCCRDSTFCQPLLFAVTSLLRKNCFCELRFPICFLHSYPEKKDSFFASAMLCKHCFTLLSRVERGDLFCCFTYFTTRKSEWLACTI